MNRTFFLFDTDTPPEEIARVIQDVAADEIPVVSGEGVPNNSGEDQNADTIDDSHERVGEPGEEPEERELPPS